MAKVSPTEILKGRMKADHGLREADQIKSL